MKVHTITWVLAVFVCTDLVECTGDDTNTATSFAPSLKDDESPKSTHLPAESDKTLLKPEDDGSCTADTSGRDSCPITQQAEENGINLQEETQEIHEQSSFNQDNEKESAPNEPVDSAGSSTVDHSDSEAEGPVLRLQAVGFGFQGQTGGDKKEDVWTEETAEGTEQKKTGGRRFFSLMNLIKVLLNPVIEEFQDIEKSSEGSSTSSPTTSEVSTTTQTMETNVNDSSNEAVKEIVNSSFTEEKDEKKNGTDFNGKKTKFQCVGRNVTENTTAVVRVVNSTVLLELLSWDKNGSESDCVVVMFYAPWCNFCATTAPHYNAVARAFPQLEVLAVDTVHFSNLNARFGTVAVPNIMLFHQSRSAVRFNHTSRHFNTLIQFITNTTGLEANASVGLSPEDYEGPLSSTPTDEMDYLLWFSWLFIIVCTGYIFITSQVGQRCFERVNVLWQEHQHIE